MNKQLIPQLIVAIIGILGYAAVAQAQVNVNTIMQQGRTNTNLVSQRGVGNRNATYQQGAHNYNRVIQKGYGRHYYQHRMRPMLPRYKAAPIRKRGKCWCSTPKSYWR